MAWGSGSSPTGRLRQDWTRHLKPGTPRCITWDVARRPFQPVPGAQTSPLDHLRRRSTSSRARSGGRLHQQPCFLQSAGHCCGSRHRTRCSSCAASFPKRYRRAGARSFVAQCARTAVRCRSSLCRRSSLQRQPDAGVRPRSRGLFRHQRGGCAAGVAQEKKIDRRPASGRCSIANSVI